MPVIINGSTGISGTDGSAGTPALQGTDTNTGMFFPAADTVAIATGGSERMRIVSNGDVGIGSTATNRLNLSYNTISGEAAVGPNSTGGNTFLTFGTSLSGSYAERMRIDSSGRVLTPFQPAFFAVPNTTGNIGTGVYVFSVTSFNVGGHYNTSNGRFTAPVSGVYHFSYGVQHNAGVTDNIIVQLRVNGSQYGNAVAAELFATASFQIVTAAATVYLNANDFVELAATNGTGWGDNTWFSGHFVG